MSESAYLGEILEELERNSKRIRDEELRCAADTILKAERVFVAGAGRTGFAVRAFSNRLMHLGLTVFFVGDSTTPAIRKGDLLFIGSGSGETASLVNMARKARESGAGVATITIYPEASIGSQAETVIRVPGFTPKSTADNSFTTVQVMGDAFEQLSWLVCDVIIHYLMERMGVTKEDMFGRHANLE